MELLKLKNMERADAPCRPGMFDDTQQLRQLTSLETQMKSLRSKGFLRPYRAYRPPTDVRARFSAVCTRLLDRPIVPDDRAALARIRLDDAELKFRVLSALCTEFGGHAVHSSRLHEMRSLAEVLLFYQASSGTFFTFKLVIFCRYLYAQ